MRSEPQVSRARRWSLLATVAAGLLLITLDNSILYTALPTLTRELGASGTESLWIINAYPLVMAGLLLGSGTLGDRIGHRRMFVVGLVIFGIASLGAAFAPSATLLIVARAVLAIGAAAMMPATLALVRVTFTDERERNVAIAIWGSVSVIGIALGPIVGGVLLASFWWGSVFLVNVPVVVVALLATLWLAPPNDPDPSKKWDLLSSVYSLIALAGAVFAIKELAHRPPSWAVVAVAAVAAVGGAWLFARRQRVLADPLLDFTIFRNPAFTAGVLGAGFAMFAIGGVQLLTTQRFQLVEGFTPLQAGLLVAAVALGSLPTALLGGAFLHLTGLRVLIAGGLGVAVLGVVVAILGATSVFWLFVTGLVIVGAGLGAVMAVASTAIVGNAPVRRAGMAASVEEVSYEFGSLLAVALLGSLVTFVYTTTAQFPSGTAEVASSSLQDALAMADGDLAVIEAAGAAFDRGFLVVLVVIAVVLAAATVLTARTLRAYGPGTRSQLHAGH